MQTIKPCLWFDNQAEEAVNFYVSLFKDSKIGTTARYSTEAANAAGREPGSVMTMTFEILGQEFMALNGGPVFNFTPAISFVVPCETQEEIDRLWEKLSREGGEEMQCGWVKDRFGLCWQIVPAMLSRVFKEGTAEQSQRVMGALLKMAKLDIATLQTAFSG
jgi:predicted 3-demethylubiquinone-9 3-methyltransferase (glyoxalase superfamily)